MPAAIVCQTEPPFGTVIGCYNADLFIYSTVYTCMTTVTVQVAFAQNGGAFILCACISRGIQFELAEPKFTAHGKYV